MSLTFEERMDILTKEQNKAKSEILNNFSKYGKTLMVRPTGFGKTKTLIDLAKSYVTNTGKRVLYIYPLDIIVTEILGNDRYMHDEKLVDGKIVRYSIVKESIDFCSYAMMTRKYNENGPEYWYNEIKDKYSLILVDEAHRAGSEGFGRIWEAIKGLVSPDGIHMLGVTATPNRMFDTDDNNILNNIFDNISISDYSIGDAIRAGLMLPLIYGKRNYRVDPKGDAKKFAAVQKAKCKSAGYKFDEESFNVEVAKALEADGSEPKFLWSYIKKAGYDLKDPRETYFKFVVFFRNIRDMADKGPMVEDWFNSCFNTYAKKDCNLRSDYKVFGHYVASSDTPEGDIAEVVSQDKEHRKFYKQTRKLNDIKRQTRTVDLLFTVDMINMGYHQDDICGIVMLRGTKSEIIYYQQLGRCLSVKAVKNPIIFDFVLNVKEFTSSKDSKKAIIKALNNGVEPTLIESIDDKDNKNKPLEFDIVVEGDENAFDALMDNWCKVEYSEDSSIKWMYVEKNAPICVIAADTGKSCEYVAGRLLELGITLRYEDAMYTHLYKSAKADNKSEEYKLMKFLFSHKALQFLEELGDKCNTIFDSIKRYARSSN